MSKISGITISLIIILSVSVQVLAQGYTTVSSNISTNTTWTAGTYYISTSINVNNGVILTINSGVVVKFAHDARLLVAGTLDVNGSDLSSNAVVFTSIDDNTYGETIAGLEERYRRTFKDLHKLVLVRSELGPKKA